MRLVDVIRKMPICRRVRLCRRVNLTGLKSEPGDFFIFYTASLMSMMPLIGVVCVPLVFFRSPTEEPTDVCCVANRLLCVSVGDS